MVMTEITKIWKYIQYENYAAETLDEMCCFYGILKMKSAYIHKYYKANFKTR